MKMLRDLDLGVVKRDTDGIFPRSSGKFKSKIKTKRDQQYNYNGEVSHNSLEAV